MAKKILNLTKSDFIENFLYVNGAPVSLVDYPHMRTVINTTPADGVVFQFARQCTKSTTMANIMLANGVMLPKNPLVPNASARGFQQMFVAPSVAQSKVFSYDRINPPMQSPFIKSRYLNTGMNQNVFEKQLANDAKFYIRYASDNADSLRGWSVDAILYDEAQDLNFDIVDVANEAMSRSYYKWNYFSGTPKLTTGTLAHYWDHSTKNEWMPKCEHCNKYNYLDEKSIGKTRLICRYCSKALDPRNGRWVRTAKSDPHNHYEGYRVSKLQFYGAPWINWQKDIVSKYETQPRAIFFNESLALPYDIGSRPVTLSEIKACCTGPPLHETPLRGELDRPNYAGLDYGPENSSKSYTLLTIIQPLPDGTRKLLYAKRYDGNAATYPYIHKDIPRQMHKWGVSLIGTDYGLGEAPNSVIREKIGHERLVPYFHHGAQKKRIAWNGQTGAFITSRNKVMTEFFQDIKNGKWIFPEYESFKSYVKDIMAPVADIDPEKHTYKFVNAAPDDTVHSCIFAKLVAELGEVAY